MKLTKSEFEIMSNLWAMKKPLSRSEILSLPHSWNSKSVHVILNGMLAKGAIREAGVVKCKKTYGRLYAPTMGEEEYWAQMVMAYGMPQMMDLGELLARVVECSGAGPKKAPEIFKRAEAIYAAFHIEEK